jgi:hypothetical protein
MPHGKSAERALTRHRVLSVSQRLTRSSVGTILDLLNSPFSVSHLKHAVQRLGAIHWRRTDRHHMDLLEVLTKQRQRLVSKDLHSEDTTFKSVNSDTNRIRRAA